MTKRRPDHRSDWQKTFVADLRSVAAEFNETLTVLQDGIKYQNGEAIIPLLVDVQELQVEAGGLPLLDREKFFVKVPFSYFQPPSVEVEHHRFLGYPHVLQGQRLCIYLDPSREWLPSAGARGFLDRLWSWLSDAAKNAFDSTNALYHAVGGVLHHTEGTPTIVYRESSIDSVSIKVGYLLGRSASRLDFSWHPSPTAVRVPVLMLSAELPAGAFPNLSTLLAQIDDPNFRDVDGPNRPGYASSEAFFTSLLTSATRNPHNSHQYFIFTIPHPSGGKPHLLAGRLSRNVANNLRRVVEDRKRIHDIKPDQFDLDIPLEWCYLSDERPEVNTRRDHSRPINALQHKKILVWGCGGLGSWLAEVISRAGISSITVCDPGRITGGLLIRQNYVEQDVGKTKSQALASRLRKINDELAVESIDGSALEPELLSGFDLIVDATINHSTSLYLDLLRGQGISLPVVGQVAVDAKTGSTGVMHVLGRGSDAMIAEVDEHAGAIVLGNNELEGYHALWLEIPPEAEVLPTRGCSIPTFHGAAADLVGLASSFASLLGRHLQVDREETVGTYLIALPHSVSSPPYAYLPYEKYI